MLFLRGDLVIARRFGSRAVCLTASRCGIVHRRGCTSRLHSTHTRVGAISVGYSRGCSGHRRGLSLIAILAREVLRLLRSRSRLVGWAWRARWHHARMHTIELIVVLVVWIISLGHAIITLIHRRQKLIKVTTCRREIDWLLRVRSTRRKPI